MIKVKEVKIAIEVKRSDAGDVLPVAMFVHFDNDNILQRLLKLFRQLILGAVCYGNSAPMCAL